MNKKTNIEKKLLILNKELKELEIKEKLRDAEEILKKKDKENKSSLKKFEVVKPKPAFISKGFEVSSIGLEWKFGLIPYPAFLNKNYKTLLVYIDRSRNLKFIGLKDSLSSVLTYMKKEDYVTYFPKDYQIYTYKNKPILWLNPESPINLQLNIEKQSFFADPETFHNIVNYVVEYRLTKGGGIGGIGDLIGKYWWVLLIIAGLIIASQQPEGLKGLLGL